MKPHTDVPGLEGLPAHVVQQRRLVAGQIRITTEERAKREQIAALLPPDVHEVTCVCVIGGREREFLVRRYNSSRDGKTRVKVEPIR